MQILYKQATKQYIHYDASARRSDLVRMLMKRPRWQMTSLRRFSTDAVKK